MEINCPKQVIQLSEEGKLKPLKIAMTCQSQQASEALEATISAQLINGSIVNTT